MKMDTTSLFFNLIISSIGMGYFIYGKKQNKLLFLADGVVMGIYPYFIKSDLTTILVGVVLVLFPFIARRYIG